MFVSKLHLKGGEIDATTGEKVKGIFNKHACRNNWRWANGNYRYCYRILCKNSIHMIPLRVINKVVVN